NLPTWPHPRPSPCATPGRRERPAFARDRSQRLRRRSRTPARCARRRGWPGRVRARARRSPPRSRRRRSRRERPRPAVDRSSRCRPSAPPRTPRPRARSRRPAPARAARRSRASPRQPPSVGPYAATLGRRRVTAGESARESGSPRPGRLGLAPAAEGEQDGEMALEIHLLGSPVVVREGVVYAAPKGRKVWALLAYLMLVERPPSRPQLVDLLFPDAEDPAGALRWNLSELRRLLGGSDTVGSGNVVRLRLPEGSTVDVQVLMNGS